MIGKIICIIALSTFSTLYVNRQLNNHHSRNMWFGDSDTDKEVPEQPRLYGPTVSCNYSEYFEDLDSNIGNNDETEATCCYVALAMLLNYYDTVLNDQIVPEAFEVQGDSYESPGTLYEADSGLPTDSVALYYNYLRNNYVNSSLHANLILTHKEALSSNPPTMANTYMDEFVSNELEMADLAETYLEDLGIDTHCTIVHNTSDGITIYPEDIVDEVKDEIDAGRPVLAGYNNHALIIYGYDENDFYIHDGYTEESNRPRLKTEKLYNFDHLFGRYGLAYMSLQFDYTHSHSYNYGTLPYEANCICGELSHYHSYTHHYVDYNSNRHRSYCECGEFILERHDYLINMFNDPCRCGRSLGL